MEETGFILWSISPPNYIETRNHYIAGMVLLTSDTTIYSRENNPFSLLYTEHNTELKRNRVSSHYLQFNAGFSLFENDMPIIDETESIINGTLKRGVGLNASYGYLIPNSIWGVGMVYGVHSANAIVAERQGSTEEDYRVSNVIHNVAPLILMYGSSKSSLFIVSFGIGYMWNTLEWDYADIAIQDKRSIVPSLALYASMEYEYRITQNLGVSGRLYLNESPDKNDVKSPDAVNVGLSLGINYHF